MKPIIPTNPKRPLRPTGTLIHPKKRKSSLPRPWSPVSFKTFIERTKGR